MRLVLALLLSWSVSVSHSAAWAADPPGAAVDAGTLQTVRASQAERYAGKVLNESANIFAPEISRSHGTGFIVELTAERGVIFTNNHVVDKGPLEAQRIRVQFASEVGLPETVTGRVVYRSPLLDFAVIEFD